MQKLEPPERLDFWSFQLFVVQRRQGYHLVWPELAHVVHLVEMPRTKYGQSTLRRCCTPELQFFVVDSLLQSVESIVVRLIILTIV